MPSSSSSSSSSASPPPVKKRKPPQNERVVSDKDENSSCDSDQKRSGNHTAVQSHAERRRQKKRNLKASEEAEPASKRRKLDDGSVAKSKPSHASNGTKLKRQNSVWVGNLSFKTTKEALRQFFDGVGEITRIHMPQKPGTKGENLGFAYVDFATPDQRVTAITLSEGQLDGRNLLIKDSSDFAGRPTKNSEGADPHTTSSSKVNPLSGLTKTAQKILNGQKQPPAPTLFLGNLGFETTEDSIRELLEAHQNFGKKPDTKRKEANDGENTGIRKIRMGTFQDSGKCKGFAFVDFTSVEHAKNVLINPRNHRLNGRDLVVEYASPEAVQRGRGVPQNAKQDPQGHKNKHPRPKARPAAVSPSQHDEPRTEQEHSDDTLPGAIPEPARDSRPERKKVIHPHQRRAKPGAALAGAARQSAAIVPSQAKKIVF